jgi:hypothetical protein
MPPQYVLALALILGVGFPMAANAAAPPDTLLSGTLLADVEKGKAASHRFQCGSGQFPGAGSASTFLRNGAGPATIMIEDNELFWKTSIGSGVYSGVVFGGAAVLNFTAAAAGIMVFDAVPTFDYPVIEPAPEFKKIPFTGYSQSYETDAKILTVSFTIQLPDCPVVFKAIYHAG